jgi:hypothetical protein
MPQPDHPRRVMLTSQARPAAARAAALCQTFSPAADDLAAAAAEGRIVIADKPISALL